VAGFFHLAVRKLPFLIPTNLQSTVCSLRQLERSLSIFVLLVMIAGDLRPVLEEIALKGQFLLQTLKR
jgi:hypothetical protein